MMPIMETFQQTKHWNHITGIQHPSNSLTYFAYSGLYIELLEIILADRKSLSRKLNQVA
jgi:hypothetical protein